MTPELEKQMIAEKVISRAKIDKMTEEIDRELEEAVEFAKKSPLPEPGSLFDNLYVSAGGEK